MSEPNMQKKQHIIYCRYSGMPLPTYPDFPTLPIDVDAHILMRLSIHQLLDEINHRKSITIRQQRLLFIALLKQTNLVIFDHPATPTDRIIEVEFHRLLDITGYICTHRFFYQTFPQYKVTRETSECGNIHHIIQAWIDVKEKHTLKRSERLALANTMADDALELKVTQALLKHKPLTPTFNKYLIQWALQESAAPTRKHISWAKIFLTRDDRHCRMCNGKKLILNPLANALEKCPNCEGKGRVSDIPKLSFANVRECRNYMVDNLPENTSYEATRKFVILKHLAFKLQSIQKYHASFGFTVLDDTPRTAEEMAAGKKAIENEPKKDDFPDLLTYLRALASFRAAQDVVETEKEPEHWQMPKHEEDFEEILTGDSEEKIEELTGNLSFSPSGRK